MLEEGVGDLAKRLLDRLLVPDQRLLRPGFRRVHAGTDATHVEDGQRHLRRDREETGGAEPVTVDRQAPSTARAGEHDAWKVIGPGHTDPRGGRRQMALGLPDVRAAFEEARRQPRRHGGRHQRQRLGQRAAPGHGLRAPPEQDGDQVLRLLDPAQDVRDRLRRRVHQYFSLPHVDQRRHAALEPELHELQ